MRTPPNDLLRVHGALLVVQICFASLAVVGRFALRDIPPNAIVLTRVAGGALVFYLIARVGGAVSVERADVPRLVCCGVLGVVINQLLFVNGLKLSSATHGSVLGATIPVFTAMFAVLLGVERWHAARFAGIVLALTGAIVLISAHQRPGSAGAQPVLGDVLIVVNCLSYSLFLVLIRPLAVKYAPMTLVALLFAVGTVVALPFGVPAWVALAPRLTPQHVWFLAFILAVPTVGAYSLNQLAMQHADPSLVAVYIYLQPLFATVGAVLLLHERPGPATAVAAGLIFAGLYLGTRPGRPVPAAHQREA